LLETKLNNKKNQKINKHKETELNLVLSIKIKEELMKRLKKSLCRLSWMSE